MKSKRIENLGHLIHLEWLDLSFNKISKIEGLESLTKINRFIFTFQSNYKLGENMNTLTNLTVLSLGKNQIATLNQVNYINYNMISLYIYGDSKIYQY